MGASCRLASPTRRTAENPCHALLQALTLRLPEAPQSQLEIVYLGLELSSSTFRCVFFVLRICLPLPLFQKLCL